jgi:hypothetical protein
MEKDIVAEPNASAENVVAPENPPVEKTLAEEVLEALKPQNQLPHSEYLICFENLMFAGYVLVSGATSPHIRWTPTPEEAVKFSSEQVLRDTVQEIRESGTFSPDVKLRVISLIPDAPAIVL